MNRIISAGFIVFRRLEKSSIEYLLLQTPTGKQHWTPPKGHLEEHETLLQAALRETKEEAGLNEEDLEQYKEFDGKITYDASGRPKDVYYFLASLRNPQQNIKLSNEHQAFIWLTLDEACKRVNQKETESVLRKAGEFIKQNLPT